ncbi:hypothetical protein DER45DRAFT_536010 [Fusarium avenaceum]|nr:hypothetical protein DER45DRAFT_536010 [Fusarium avenaceum]
MDQNSSQSLTQDQVRQLRRWQNNQLQRVRLDQENPQQDRAEQHNTRNAPHVPPRAEHRDPIKVLIWIVTQGISIIFMRVCSVANSFSPTALLDYTLQIWKQVNGTPFWGCEKLPMPFLSRYCAERIQYRATVIGEPPQFYVHGSVLAQVQQVIGHLPLEPPGKFHDIINRPRSGYLHGFLNTEMAALSNMSHCLCGWQIDLEAECSHANDTLASSITEFNHYSAYYKRWWFKPNLPNVDLAVLEKDIQDNRARLSELQLVHLKASYGCAGSKVSISELERLDKALEENMTSTRRLRSNLATAEGMDRERQEMENMVFDAVRAYRSRVKEIYWPKEDLTKGQ